MFLDDLLNGSRRQMAAPFYDVIAFSRDWGFRLDEVKVHVRWWHGDADHIVPVRAREHVVSRLPDAELYPMPGESHLGGLGRAEEILRSMLGDVGQRRAPTDHESHRAARAERSLDQAGTVHALGLGWTSSIDPVPQHALDHLRRSRVGRTRQVVPDPR